MADPTAKDIENANIYANQRYKLLLLDKLHKKYPHITSHLTVNITKANQTDYYYPKSFEKRAIMVDIIISKDACDQIECIPWTESGPCGQYQKAENTRIGDSGKIITSCKPACFNLKTETVFEDGVAQVHIPQVVWNNHQEQCQFASATDIWMNFPISRDTARYTDRLNDFSEGFNQIPSNTTLTGTQYTYTKDYCQLFGEDLEGSGENLNCEEPLWLFFLDAIVGKQFVLTLTEAIGNAVHSNPLREDSRPKAPPLDDKWLVENWKKNINTNFVLPDINIEVSDTMTYSISKTTNNIFTLKKILIGDKIQTKDIDPIIRRRLEQDAITFNNPATKKLDAVTIGSILAIIGAAGYGIYSEQLGNIIISLFNDPKTYAGLSDTVVFAILQKVTKQLGKLFEKLASKVTVTLTEGIVKATTITMLRSTITKLGFKIVSKIITTLTKIIAQIESVVGIIFLLTTFFDIILSFWDPFGFNNQFPDGYLKDLQSNLDFGLLNALETSDPTITFEIYCSLLFTQDEITELSLNQFEYIYEYLDSLIVNSEGSRINKGPEISIDYGNSEEEQIIHNANQIKIYTQDELFRFQNDHLIRVKNIKAYKYLGIISMTLACLLFIVKFEILAILIFIFAIIFTLIGYFALNLDFVFDYDISKLYDIINATNTVSRFNI